MHPKQPTFNAIKRKAKRSQQTKAPEKIIEGTEAVRKETPGEPNHPK
jgi:hypothetical protein